MLRHLLPVLALAFAAAPAFAFSPSVLSEEDKALYREIFELQEDARWSEADRKITALSDEVLLGYVRLERYMHPTAYRSSYGELKQWMAYYADLPDANRIYALARRKHKRGDGATLTPIARKWRAEPSAPLHPDLVADYARTGKSRLNQIEGRVRYLVRREQATNALKEIERHFARGAVTERQFDRMRSWIAASFYYQGYVARAEEIAEEVVARNGDVAVLAYWISGLIQFRNGDVAQAHERFAAMARVEEQEDSLRAAAGFWAARTALADGHVADVAPLLEIAASFPFTFYGQLALAQLGRDYEYRWTAPALTGAAFENLAQFDPAVKRAVALYEVGRINEADLEFRWINGRVDDAHAVDLMALESALDLPAAQLDLALYHKGAAFEAGLFPIPPYAPADGFATDRALLYALMRQESKFKVEATSRVGARGLMQLMPRTASFVARDRTLQRGKGRDKLYDPALNLAIGQDYVNYLINTSAEGDLFNMALAYNGGPGNLRRWKRDLPVEDPLLFIESIPNPESRDFVEHVLTNFWIYRQRLGQKPHSRDRVAAGLLPLHEALDEIVDSQSR
ncbi:MAG: transglycosylase SLT domain-containing protein [Parvularculaceae bacterium]|nr:transglycosylase SLT domain-containing protein [Parvularculaceae bacterium]